MKADFFGRNNITNVQLIILWEKIITIFLFNFRVRTVAKQGKIILSLLCKNLCELSNSFRMITMQCMQARLVLIIVKKSIFSGELKLIVCHFTHRQISTVCELIEVQTCNSTNDDN